MEPRVGQVWSWGKGKNCLGTDYGKQENQPLPQKIKGLHQIINISCGESMSAAVDKNGILYTWGNGTAGCLAQPEVKEYEVPTKVSYLSKITVIQVSCGENHMGCVTNEKFAYLWGNGLKGALGNGISTQKENKIPIQLILNNQQPLQNIIQIDCGYQNSAVVTSNNELYLWGDNKYSKLGFNEDSRPIITTPLLQQEIKAKQVSLGSLFGGCVDINGDVFMWGYGGGGNLGQGNRKSYSTPQKVKNLNTPIKSINCTKNQINPILFNDNSKPQECDGRENPKTFAVAENGMLFAWGPSHKGMLGNLSKKNLCPQGMDELYPYQIGAGSILRDTQQKSQYFTGGIWGGPIIQQALAGSIHSSVLDYQGNVYCFGCGSDGRCGVMRYLNGLHGSKSRLKCYISQPTRIHLDQVKVLQIATSRRHMLALGIPSDDKINSLKEIELIQDEFDQNQDEFEQIKEEFE